MATTAVVAGTAGAVRHHQDQKYAGQAADQQAMEQQQMQAQQIADLQAQQAAAAPVAAAPVAAAPVDPVTAQLENLANLHTQGILSDEEFAAAKAKALGI